MKCQHSFGLMLRGGTSLVNIRLNTTTTRSKIMSHIHSVETKPEIKLRKALWKRGVRYRKNFHKLPGSPDIAITQNKIAIFVDGEFWHGYHWGEKKGKLKRNRKYWIKKIERNMERDKQNNKDLKNMDWTVIRFWSNMVNHHLDYCVELILFKMRNSGEAKKERDILKCYKNTPLLNSRKLI